MDRFYDLERQIELQRQQADVPGVALAIVQGQHVVYAGGFGSTAIEDSCLPVSPHTLFRIASTTKPLTGTAAMHLVEQGKLNLDTPIRNYVPWLNFSRKGAAEQITLRLLLSHRSGLPTEYQRNGNRDPTGLEAYVREEIPALPLLAPPGTEWHYSNPGINLAGYVVEAVCGRYFSEAMEELIFAPLQMSRTTFELAVAMTYPLAQAHHLNEQGQWSVLHRFWDRAAGNPSGGAFSTVLDMARFAVLHLNQGRFEGRQLLSSASIREMHTPQSNLVTSTGKQYGLTFFVERYKGMQRIEHWGGCDSFSSRFVLAPEAGLAVIVLHNRMASSFNADGLINSIFDQALDLPPYG